MNRVLLGKNLPLAFSISDKGVPLSIFLLVEVSTVELLALFVTFGAENFVKGQRYCSPKKCRICD